MTKQELNRWINCKSAFLQTNHLDGWSTRIYCFAKSAKEYNWKLSQFNPDKNYKINAYYK